ncbi:hypothetical protein, partial [Bryocella elongata]|uniref:hypothetical protein n=1 Tax=Bryocella elongata TaxID=863522 RepID=UPI001F3B86D4
EGPWPLSLRKPQPSTMKRISSYEWQEGWGQVTAPLGAIRRNQPEAVGSVAPEDAVFLAKGKLIKRDAFQGANAINPSCQGINIE